MQYVRLCMGDLVIIFTIETWKKLHTIIISYSPCLPILNPSHQPCFSEKKKKKRKKERKEEELKENPHDQNWLKRRKKKEKKKEKRDMYWKVKQQALTRKAKTRNANKDLIYTLHVYLLVCLFSPGAALDQPLMDFFARRCAPRGSNMCVDWFRFLRNRWRETVAMAAKQQLSGTSWKSGEKDCAVRESDNTWFDCSTVQILSPVCRCCTPSVINFPVDFFFF